MTFLTLKPLSPVIHAVHNQHGVHVGNLKLIGVVWKFKAIGYDESGDVLPGGGPLTGFHNTVFNQPDEREVNLAMLPKIDEAGQ